MQGDVANLADLDRLYAAVKLEKGKVDIVVANAGFIEHAKIFDMSEAHYDKTMDINVKGVVFTVQKALPLMSRGGSIVIVSSVINVKGVPAHGTYAAAKAGVRALVRVWAQELKDEGIRVNSLSPGATETPIIRGQFDSDEASDAAKSMFASMTPLGRLGLPDELAAGAYFLASDESQLRHWHRSSHRRRPGSGLTPFMMKRLARLKSVRLLHGQSIRSKKDDYHDRVFCDDPRKDHRSGNSRSTGRAQLSRPKAIL